MYSHWLYAAACRRFAGGGILTASAPGSGPTSGMGVSPILGLLASKWTVPIVRCLVEGRQRPCELTEKLPGLSQKVLTQTLRRLQRSGLVARQMYSTVPPKVDYRLTPCGLALLGPLEELEFWAAKHGAGVEASHRPSRRSRGK